MKNQSCTYRFICKIFVTIVFVFLTFLFLPILAYAADDVYLEPNSQLDLSGIRKATNVHIEAGGNYYLYGNTDNALLYINVPAGSSASVHFTTDTTITPDTDAPGSLYVSRAAITVEDTGGEVILITYPNSTVTVKGYREYPAIRKDGLKTTLRFRTKDSISPGKLIAKADDSFRVCAIGCYSQFTDTARKTGNMYFESGNIEAYGSDCGYDAKSIAYGGGAGIGAGADGSVDGLYFTGANVNAVGGDSDTAAIGTASNYVPPILQAIGYPEYLVASCKNLVFTAGNINAAITPSSTTGGAAVIGGGAGSDVSNIFIGGTAVLRVDGKSGNTGIGAGEEANATNIRITGGDVYSLGRNAGIGAGYSQDVYDDDRYRGMAEVNISGGTVYAKATTTGVGIGGSKVGNKKGGKTNITITGGKVTAIGSKDGSGIGCSNRGRVLFVNISGGVVYAEGGEDGFGIGTGTAQNTALEHIAITGGNVTAVGGRNVTADIGGYANLGPGSRIPTNIYISGGHIIANKGILGLQPKQQENGPDVYPNSITFEDFGHPYVPLSEIKAITARLEDGSAYAYGCKDVQINHSDKVMNVWVPDQAKVVSMESTDAYTSNQDHMITGESSASTKTGTLYPGIYLQLNSNYRENDYFYMRANYLVSQNFHLPATACTRTGYNFLGFYPKKANPNTPENPCLIDANGALLPNVSGYTNSNGVWSYIPTKDTFENNLNLWAQWEKKKATVSFNANKPKHASTTVSGSMASISNWEYNTNKTLPANTYHLNGYRFTGWNTKSDGSGTGYSDGASIKNTWDSNNVVLYAQWSAYTYQLQLSPLNGTEIETQTLTFDQTAVLKENPPTKDHSIFVGWLDNRTVFQRIYRKGSKIYNLCEFDSNGVPQGITLTAVWGSSNEICISITDNEQPVTGKTLTLTEVGSGATYQPFTEKPGTPGLYISSVDFIPLSELELTIPDYDTENIIIDNTSKSAQSLHYNFCTVEIDAENHATSWIGSSGTTRIDKVLEGSELQIDTNTDNGYVFEAYTAIGTAPTWNPNQETPNQTITIHGKVLIEAHPIPHQYQVVFNAHGGTGTMSNQDMLYDEPQDLGMNQFRFPGYTFAGWTLTPEWTGTLYQDGERVQNLTDSADTVTLYAQWRNNPYMVHFCDNGCGSVMMDQEMFYDLEEELSPVSFVFPEHHFIGWNTENDGSGTSYSDEQSVKNLISSPSANEVSLFAQWERDTYIVHFEPNGGTGSMPNQTVARGIDHPLEPNAFQKNGYRFKQWTTNADGTGTAYPDTDAIYNLVEKNQTITLYAQWTEAIAMITYKSGTHGKVNSVSENVLALSGTPKGSVAIPDSGYHLKNWTDENGQIVSTEDKLIPHKNKKKIYESKTYTANFAPDDSESTDSPLMPSSYPAGQGSGLLPTNVGALLLSSPNTGDSMGNLFAMLFLSIGALAAILVILKKLSKL